MIWIIGVGLVWIFCCALAVSLCVMARRGDDVIAAAVRPPAEPVLDVDFVATLVSRDDQLHDLELHQRRAVRDRAR
jgi:hypothetical protein